MSMSDFQEAASLVQSSQNEFAPSGSEDLLSFLNPDFIGPDMSNEDLHDIPGMDGSASPSSASESMSGSMIKNESGDFDMMDSFPGPKSWDGLSVLREGLDHLDISMFHMANGSGPHQQVDVMRAMKREPSGVAADFGMFAGAPVAGAPAMPIAIAPQVGLPITDAQRDHLSAEAAAAAVAAAGALDLSGRQISPIFTGSLANIAPPSLPDEQSTSASSSGASSPAKSSKKRRQSEAGTSSRKKSTSASSSRAKQAPANVALPAAAALPGVMVSAEMAAPAIPKQEPSEISAALPMEGTPEANMDPGALAAQKRQDRLMRNRAAALASRERKREHVARLETSVEELEREKLDLKRKIGKLERQVIRLQARLKTHGDDMGKDYDLEDEGEDVQSVRAISEDVQMTEAAIASAVAGEATKKSKPKPTGFSPRGSIKAAQIAAQAQQEPTQNAVVSACTEKDKSHKTHTSGVVLLIIFFGFALFASHAGHGSILANIAHPSAMSALSPALPSSSALLAASREQLMKQFGVKALESALPAGLVKQELGDGRAVIVTMGQLPDKATDGESFTMLSPVESEENVSIETNVANDAAGPASFMGKSRWAVLDIAVRNKKVLELDGEAAVGEAAFKSLLEEVQKMSATGSGTVRSFCFRDFVFGSFFFWWDDWNGGIDTKN
ncbi:hypothetical protein G7K_5324-t4 [Saitoella complicata NRRL Y-17804]|nr:hypothetical protein G7K_5324-t4 [Saitoella complicata NRRL Y-17804]